MASTRRKTTKDGRCFYEIRVQLGRGKPQYSERWYVPKGWSKKAIDRELTKVAAEFERRCQAGEVLTKQQQKQREKEAAIERAKIRTVKEYAEQVFLPRKSITLAQRTITSYR